MSQPVLHVNHLNKVYGKKNENQFHALKDVSFDIESGEFVGIMGPSGAGKTTLLNVISTLDQSSSGTIEIAGTNITAMKQNQLADFRSEQLGFIFQDFNLLENLTVYENIALPLSLKGVSTRHIKPSVMNVAQKLGIEKIIDKYPITISGGQKQRVAAARALVHEPAMILADEPTGALDSKNAKSLMETLVHLNEKLNTSIMLVTHDPLSASYCQRILFIQDGQLYKEIHRNTTRNSFHQEILDVLAEFATSNELE
ncbi:MAG: ABC transporter ATP-binding protein [Bacillota bacterium]|uniref:ABC transporter ATP-binding protein n=1 Tax=Virgibacillus salarius TaxID=447199 RepID=A0A941DX72_9BACI|nr:MULTISPECIES: ABC transporter ATP-binding protein [Bacillaceae]NAZ09846.1 ATP-binding cassette domain-containing protein [Agaribacter marinus]MBR7797137.1 ABC transporter ATP-binding protein [Virgibacillus salarius]MCC2249879.1 ABC transporter ATP-binding protein [Virgibacillus sp. AGTR]MDY7045568.1 ABC transporter ATP-binding protein [Virgibacillus sp. M23]QRZ18654.1 ABC transporter ATP-binding protein [Virgibacillus sp. AGTR]